MSNKIIYVDVGAWGGGCSKSWAKDKKIDLLYAFEPNRNIFPCLKKSVEPFNNVKIFEAAVTNIDGKLVFYENNKNDTGSLLPLDADGIKKLCDLEKIQLIKTIDSYLVTCVRLKTFMEKEGIDHINFLKIDTQGQDFEVVKSLDEYIKRVKYIYLEVQISNYEVYKGQSKKQDILDYMSNHDFIIKRIIGQGQEENILFENTIMPWEPIIDCINEALGGGLNNR